MAPSYRRTSDHENCHHASRRLGNGGVLSGSGAAAGRGVEILPADVVGVGGARARPPSPTHTAPPTPPAPPAPTPRPPPPPPRHPESPPQPTAPHTARPPQPA